MSHNDKIIAAKAKFREDLETFMKSMQGDSVVLTDYVVTATGVDMNTPVRVQNYLTEYVGNMHSAMGLTMFQLEQIKALNREEIDAE